jgi:quercetin dioxygenase-like cupin family protein
MSRYFPKRDEQSRHTIFPGVDIATSSCERLMISIADFEPHAVVEWHAHPHEQCGVVVKGKAIFCIGDEEKTLQPGDIYFMPGNVRHKVVALDEAVRAIDIFTPIRDDYR